MRYSSTFRGDAKCMDVMHCGGVYFPWDVVCVWYGLVQGVQGTAGVYGVAPGMGGMREA